MVVAPVTVASVGRHGWINLIGCLSLQGEDIVPVCLVAAVFGLVGQQVKGKTPIIQIFSNLFKKTLHQWSSFVQGFFFLVSILYVL